MGGLNALGLLRLAGNSFEGLAPTALRQAQDHDLGFGPRCRPGIAGATGLQRDCGVLLAVRDELAGEVKLNWGAAAPIDFWRGVTLGGEPPRVIALDLTNLGLTGSIPTRLGDLDALASLRLGRNALVGTIPDTLGKLANLSELVLDGNALTGRIPRELGRLANLATLRLRNNGLHGAIPAELGRLGNLRQLALDNNALSGRIPRSLGGLSALQELWLAGNELAEATSHIQATPMLSRALRDASPAPGAAPTRPSAPPSQPTAPGSELFCTPGGAGNEELLRDCRTLLRSAMDWWGDPAALNWRVDVPLERWKGIGLSGQPARVTSIDVSGLGLRGGVPRPLTRLSALETLRMADNELFGAIPGRLGRLRALREVALERNELTGPVPTSIENLPALSELRLNDNALTGHLVGRLERLPSLSTMRLGGNDFLGCVPEPVRGLGDRRLELDIDCGPTPWSKPPLLEDAATLMASRDALAAGATLNWSYDMPVTAWQGVTVDGSPPRVVALDLANVGLAGRIPGELGALSALVRLDLSGNALTGGVPPPTWPARQPAHAFAERQQTHGGTALGARPSRRAGQDRVRGQRYRRLPAPNLAMAPAIDILAYALGALPRDMALPHWRTSGRHAVCHQRARSVKAVRRISLRAPIISSCRWACKPGWWASAHSGSCACRWCSTCAVALAAK